MGSVKRKYCRFDFDLEGTSRTVTETQTYIPLIRSCTLTLTFMNLAYEEIRFAIVQREKIDHKLIVQKLYNIMDETDKSGFNWHNRLVDLHENFKFIYSPMVEGGDHYNLNYKSLDKNQSFAFDIVRIAIGINNSNTYSTFVRTLMINPTEQIKYNYVFLMNIQRVIAYNLRDGVELRKVFEIVMSFAENENRYLAKHLKKDFGYSLSSSSQNDLVINSNTNATAKYGMTFSMDVLLMRLEEAGRVYDLCSSDTVFVRKNEPAEILTYNHRNTNVAVFTVPDNNSSKC